MAVPRNRLSNARKNSRRAHHAKTATNMVSCSNCQSKKRSHRICPKCGYYAGRSLASGEEK